MIHPIRICTRTFYYNNHRKISTNLSITIANIFNKRKRGNNFVLTSNTKAKGKFCNSFLTIYFYYFIKFFKLFYCHIFYVS